MMILPCSVQEQAADNFLNFMHCGGSYPGEGHPFAWIAFIRYRFLFSKSTCHNIGLTQIELSADAWMGVMCKCSGIAIEIILRNKPARFTCGPIGSVDHSGYYTSVGS